MTERERFVMRFALEYLQRHPRASNYMARKQARLRWQRRQRAIRRNATTA